MARPFRLPRPRRADPEGDLQRRIVALLREARIDFCHVPNSTGRGNARKQGELAVLGVEPGVPDLLIFDPPPCRKPLMRDPYAVALRGLECANQDWWPIGACLELKGIDRVKPVWPWEDRRATPEQRAFLRRRAASGLWAVAVAGPSDAEAQLRAWGYLP